MLKAYEQIELLINAPKLELELEAANAGVNRALV